MDEDEEHISRDCRLFQRLPGVYYVLRYADQHWRVIRVTQQAELLFKYNTQEIYSMATNFLQTIILPEDLQMVVDGKKIAFQEEKLFDLEFRIKTKNGEIKFVRDQYTVYADGDDWIMEGYISETFKTNFRDRLMQQLRSYREAVDVNIISSITDRKGKIVYANENFCRVSKYSMAELIGQNHRIVNSGHHPPEFFENLWQTIAKGKVWQGEILNKAKDGSLYWVETVIIPIFDEERKIVNYLSLRMLINERKEAENARKKYIHLLEQIAFIVAHNVRGPLCRILGLTNLLTYNHEVNKDNQQINNYLQAEAINLNEITRQLSDFVYTNEIEIKLKEYNSPNSHEL